MNQHSQFLQAATEMDSLLREKLKARGDTARARLHHVRRKLPAKIRAQAQLVSDTAERMRLAHQPGLSDPRKVLDAHRSVIAHLNTIDLKALKEERRIGRRKWVADLVLNYGLFLALLIAGYYIATSQ